MKSTKRNIKKPLNRFVELQPFLEVNMQTRFDKEFAEYCHIPYAAGVNNGTSALHCAMAALGKGEGDEVIVPANTYIATAWGVTYTGATPLFVDCTADTWEIRS